MSFSEGFFADRTKKIENPALLIHYGTNLLTFLVKALLGISHTDMRLGGG